MNGNDGLLVLIEILNELSVPYMLVGSYSSNLYGIPRSTKDADLVLEVSGDALKNVQGALPPEISFEEQGFFEMVTATRKELLNIEGTAFQIELFHLSEDQFDQERFGRRVKVPYGDGLEVWFPTAEDVVVQKLRWARGGKRTKDYDDVVTVMKVHRDFDFEYITHWCGLHETLPLLEQAKAEAGL